MQRGARCLFSPDGARRENDGWFFPGPSAAASREEKSFKRIKQHPPRWHVLGRNFRRQNSFKTWLPRRPLRSIVHAPWAPSRTHTHTPSPYIYLSRRVRDSFSTRVRAVQITLLREQDLQPLSRIMATFFSQGRASSAMQKKYQHGD